MRFMETDIIERVETGAAWLDKVRPGWENEVAISRLNLASGCGCVMGQLVKKADPGIYLPNYSDVVTGPDDYQTVKSLKENVNSALKPLVMGHKTAVKRGFHVTKDGPHAEWSKLTQAWKDLIRTRRAAAK